MIEVKINLAVGPMKATPTKSDIEKNIQMLKKVYHETRPQSEKLLCVNTISILNAIQEQLPG